MKFSKYIFKAVTPVMALFQKQRSCLSNKATTLCGQAAESLRQVPVRHDREGKFAEIKVRFVPPTMYRLTAWNEQEVFQFENKTEIQFVSITRYLNACR